MTIRDNADAEELAEFTAFCEQEARHQALRAAWNRLDDAGKADYISAARIAADQYPLDHDMAGLTVFGLALLTAAQAVQLHNRQLPPYVFPTTRTLS